MRDGKKIQAIKDLRTVATLNLREAKHAIEHEMAKKGLSTIHGQVNFDVELYITPVITNLTVDLGDGPVEVDIESMELHALMNVEKLGLENCAEILDLVKVLQAYSEGKKIGILPEENVNISS